MTIFRPEVIDNQGTRLEGEVSLALPLSWQVLGGFFFLIVVVAIGFLLTSDFSRIETVTGRIEPEGGIVRVVPSVAGTLQEIRVDIGDSVVEGFPLATIRTELTLADGMGNAEAESRILARESLGLARQEAEISAAARSRGNEIDREILDRRAAIASLNNQIAIQKELLTTARQDLEKAEEIASRGFISKRDVDLRRERYFSRQQDLLRLQREAEQNSNAIAELTERKSTIRSEAGTQLAALETERSDVAQRGRQSRLQSAQRLTSPVAGSVAAVAAQLGDRVTSGEPIILVLPADSALVAQLDIPSSAIGFLEVGQTVELAVDAFPSVHFGTVPGRIETIAAAPVSALDADGRSGAHFRVSVTLSRDWVMTDNGRRPLVAGMTCAATIITEKRTLMDWLLRPLLSA